MKTTLSVPSPGTFPIATGLRRALSLGYTRDTLKSDLLAGLVVGIVALPLSMALSIAVGMPPQNGLYTAIVGGFIAALLGGSKFQVTGPTAAFVVILAPIVTRHGSAGLLTAGMMAGVLLIAMGAMRLGRLVQFIPHPVTTGFTAGIATVIATLQLKDALGLHVGRMPDDFLGKVRALWGARASFSPRELLIALVTLALLLTVPKITRRVPAPLIAIAGVAFAVALAHRVVPSFEVATLGSRFHTTLGGHLYAGIPPLPPRPQLPWGEGRLSLAMLRELFPSACAIAMLGAIESLLSAVVADGMTGKRHDPNAELVGQGIGNLVAPFFGGIAATGALARTATNIRAGAVTPIAAATHAVVVLLCMIVLAPLVAYVPMASLAGLLLLVAWNMAEARNFVHIVKVAPRSDVIVLITCFTLTVVFDMVVAVGTGVVLAAMLFMRRMAELTNSTLLLEGDETESSRTLPRGVALYSIVGSLFFGAAQNAMAALGQIHSGVKVVVLDLTRVLTVDATGLQALESSLDELRRAKREVLIAGSLPQPLRVFERAQLAANNPHVTFCDSLDEAIRIAGERAAERYGASRTTPPAVISS